MRDALREARLEAAERTAVIIDFKAADIARLELLNEAIDPVFAEIPDSIDFFDRGISRGEIPRLWIDMIAYVVLERDRRVYRFIQDTRNGPRILAESASSDDMVREITRYVARRIVERERALAAEDRIRPRRLPRARPHRRWQGVRNFLIGLVLGVVAVFVAAWIAASQL